MCEFRENKSMRLGQQLCEGEPADLLAVVIVDKNDVFQNVRISPKCLFEVSSDECR